MSVVNESSSIKICCNPKGPIIVEGQCNIVDKYGRPLCTENRKKAHVLCGCGQSKNKPFCDGNHNRGQEDEEDDISN